MKINRCNNHHYSHRENENQCPNSSFKKLSQKEKNQQQKCWPSVKQLRTRYEENALTNTNKNYDDDDDFSSDNDSSCIIPMEKKRKGKAPFRHSNADETITNLCPSYCKWADKKSGEPTNYNEEGATTTTTTTPIGVVQSNHNCSTSSSSSDSAVPVGTCLIYYLSQLTLMGLTLFEMHRSYRRQNHTNSSNHGADSSSSWQQKQQQMLHAGFVFALFVKSAYQSTKVTIRDNGSSLPDDNTKRRRSPMMTMKKIACFMCHMFMWTITIPLFNECNFINAAYNSYTCFSPTIKPLSQLGGKAYSVVECAPRYSLLDVVVTNSCRAIVSLLKSMIKGRLLNQVWKEIQRALYNPFQFQARVQKARIILRWFRYIGPLVGTCNKLRGNLIDMAKKRRQHRVSKAALKRWHDVIDALSKQSKTDHAVVQLQKAFRERRVRVTKKRQLLLSASRRWIRTKLEEEEGLTRAKLEQIALRDMDRKQRRQVSFEERRGFVLHKESSRRRMKQLLLNPKSSFSVIWKYLSVTCVVLEIMTILFAPVLSGDVRKMSLDQFIVRVLLGSRQQCNNEGKKRVAPSLFIPTIGSISDITCSASKVKQTWFVVAHIVATMLVPTVNCICFLDVFVTFLTGELSSNGTLVPKPFFERWILPGPVLQLLVNPTMKSTKTMLLAAFGSSMNIGPSLCMHCILACKVFAAYLYDRLFDAILDVVEKINELNAHTVGVGGEVYGALQWT